MVLQCLPWIPERWIQLINSNVSRERYLPDNVIFDIFTRLPPQSVMECRKVCKQWFAITKSPYFVKMHPRKTASLLLVQLDSLLRPKRDQLALLIFDEDTQKFSKMRSGWITLKEKNSVPLLVGCCHIKLVFQSRLRTASYYLWDLLTREKVVIDPPKQSIYLGIFFHPEAREYIMLFNCQVKTRAQYEILIYGCSSKTWRELDAFSIKVYVSPDLVELNDNLHWLARSLDENGRCRHFIITFNMYTEKFSSAPLPVRDQCGSSCRHMNMQLLEMEGLLSFCNVGITRICIWVLEDYCKWSWEFAYKVELNLWDMYGFPFTYRSYLRTAYKIRLWSIKNGELKINWIFRGLFLYNLENKTLRKLCFSENEICRSFLVSLDLSRS